MDKINKHAKFRTLAQKRTQACLKQISLIGNLSMSGYESTPEEREAVFGALQSALDGAVARFSPNAVRDNAFTLPS